MSCSDCAKTDIIPECSEKVEVGRSAFNNQDIHIFVQDIATGRIEHQDATTNVSGGIELDLTKPSKDFYKAGKDYEVWATTSTLKLSRADALPFTIAGDSETVVCVLIKFAKLYDADVLLGASFQLLKRVV